MSKNMYKRRKRVPDSMVSLLNRPITSDVVNNEPVIASEPIIVSEPIAASKTVMTPEPIPVPQRVVAYERSEVSEPVVTSKPVTTPKTATTPETATTHETATTPEPVATHETVTNPLSALDNALSALDAEPSPNPTATPIPDPEEHIPTTEELAAAVASLKKALSAKEVSPDTASPNTAPADPAPTVAAASAAAPPDPIPTVAAIPPGTAPPDPMPPSGGSATPPPTKWKIISRIGKAYIAVACVLALFVTGTYAYLTYQTNQTANIFAIGQVELVILEKIDGANADMMVDDTIAVKYGNQNKQVAFGIPSGTVDSVVRASFALQVVSDQSTQTNTLYHFINSGSLTKPDSENKVVMGSSGITLHFASDWQTYWTFRETGPGSGFFYYTGNGGVVEAGGKTPYLLTGVTYNGSSTEQVEIVVNAEALQATPEAAQEAWGVTL